MKVVVIGGGPSGMMAAITAKQEGNEVILLEKMNLLGKKLLITGKGRCNITSSLDMEEFIKNTPGNGMFLYSSYKNYTNSDIIQFLKNQGLEVKEERGNRIFPVTDKSQDVLNCFKKKLKELKVKIECNTEVKEIITSDSNKVKAIDVKIDKRNTEVKEIIKNDSDKVKVIGVNTNKGFIKADKVILATGGKSYPLTGSDGYGYELAKKLGHTIVEPKPSLVPLETYEQLECKALQGLSLKNVAIRLLDINSEKKIYEDFGEMLFTHFGISGPVVLSASAHLIRYKNLQKRLDDKQIIFSIDLKPALSEKKLDERILRDFQGEKNKLFKNSLDRLLPQKMIQVVINRSMINPDKQVNEVTKEERKRLVKILKNFEVTVKAFRPIEEAIITSGGVSIKEIDPKTMQSKKVDGLYFAGEIIDVDAYTGGFNLQIAYSTGYTAGLNI